MFHRDHNIAGRILHKAIVDAPNMAIGAIKDHFDSLPEGHRHHVVTKYAKKYLTGADAGDEMAAHLHKSGDYAGAASQVDRATDEYAGMHDMMAYNMGADHPVVKAARELYHQRKDLTSSYRKTVGLDKEDTDSQFNEIMKRSNLSGQFGE